MNMGNEVGIVKSVVLNSTERDTITCDYPAEHSACTEQGWVVVCLCQSVSWSSHCSKLLWLLVSSWTSVEGYSKNCVYFCVCLGSTECMRCD